MCTFDASDNNTQQYAVILLLLEKKRINPLAPVLFLSLSLPLLHAVDG